MKLFKKLASFILAFAMVMAIAVPSVVLADGNYSITITGAKAGHTFEAYQIFSGDLSGDTLSNIEWGSGVSEAVQSALGDAKDKAASLNDSNAADFASEVAGYLATPAGNSNTPDQSGNYVISGLQPGYYLVKDKDGTITGQDSYTKFILKVVKNVKTKVKNEVPESYKKVKDTNDSTGETTDWQDSADYDIGDEVPFQLTGTVASDYMSYKSAYKLVFHDKLSEGLTLKEDSIKVYKNDEETPLSTDSYTIDLNPADGHSFDVTINDVRSLSEGVNKIRVEYTAKLNEKAVLGAAGNPNTMYMDFSNNPNSTQGGEKGTTPNDKVIVFTYQTIVNKVDSDNQPLTGAEFTLSKKVNGEWKQVGNPIKNDEGTTFTFKGLDDGDYRLTETKTPDGYNTMEPIEFTITADHDVKSDNPQLTGLNGNVTTGDITFTSNLTDGSLTTNVVNKKGSELPSTGGMGTTILYVAGTLMIIAAAAFLVMKKKAENK